MPNESIHAVAHLGRSLVGEGHSEDGIGGNSKIINEMRDAVSDDARFSGARARQNQNRTIDLLGGFSLLRIKFTEVQRSQFTGEDSSHESGHLRGLAL